MDMRLVVALALIAAPAAADTFGGFSGVSSPYLINQDRVCAPLAVKDGAATGVPKCEKTAADALAGLSIKAGVEQSGDKASFAASAQGKTLTVTKKDGSPVVTWNAPDPIGKVVAVYASPYEDRVAVAYTVRRLGKEVTDVVAFEVVKTTGRSGDPALSQPPASSPTPTPAPTATTVDPKVSAAVAQAMKSPKALAGWKNVLAIDPSHGEALYRVAQIELAAKHKAEAIAALEQLAASTRGDAIEWLVEARFDAAFAALRAEPKFRASVGLDRKAQNAYERAMGFGGQWEQTGTSCDKAEVKLQMMRDRSFKLRVKTVCEGHILDLPFHGTWRIDGDQLVLTLPTASTKASAKDEAPCKFERAGDEDALRCKLDRDLEFTVLPTRR
jgi:hypothetical protein